MPAGAVTTQPMGMPRPNGGGPARPTTPPPRPAGRPPGTPSRSTQRIVLPTPTPGGLGSTKNLGLSTPTGRINLPIGMILRALPPEVLAGDIAEFEATGAAATEIGLPLNLILGQLPSGKVEMTLGELVPHFPPGFLQPTASITSYLPNLVNLPLMDVVMRIPPDLLALRPDQKDVDASVINMADPFTEEILREQAEAARRQTQTASSASSPNIIDESQVKPAEEFVPRDQAPAMKSFIPPPRPAGTPPPPPKPNEARPSFAAAMRPRTSTMPPPPPFPTPARPVENLGSGGLLEVESPAPPTPPSPSSRPLAPSPSGRLPAPIRAGTPIPARPQAAVTSPVSLPVPEPPQPAARAATPISVPATPVSGPPLARPTTSLPLPPRPSPVPQIPQPPLRPPVNPATPSVPALPRSTSDTPPPEPPAAEPATPQPAPAETALEMPSSGPDELSLFPKPGEPDAAAEELQRLAARAMQELPEASTAAAAEAATSMTGDSVGFTGPLPTEESASQQAAAPEAASLPPPLPAPEATSQPLPPPPTPVETPSLQPVAAPGRPLGARSITAPMPPPSVIAEPAAPASAPEPAAEAPAAPEPAPAAGEGGASMALNLNNCTPEELLQIPGCTQLLADSIVRYRTKIGGSFKRLEDLLEVPGMNSAAYSALTGEAPPQSGVTQSIADLLGFPSEQKVSLKDVTDRIGCWPDVTGCVLSQKNGLHLVGHVPPGFDRAAIVAFAPKMFEGVNKSFGEIAGKETDELIIPTTGTSFHIFRSHDLYLIILCRLPQMPDRHAKIARLVLAGLDVRPS